MFEKLIKKLAGLLKSKEIPYMIIGGQAVLLYGEPRLTRDIDITLGVGTDKLPQLMDSIKKTGLRALPDNPSKFATETWVLPCEDDKTKIRVDFIFSFTDYEKQAINNSRKVKVGGTTVNYASPEDVIIHKIFAGRPRDIEDVKSILAKSDKIDVKYIRTWLREFDQISPEKGFLEVFNNLLKSL